jgi:hypothetical protein
MQSVEHYSSLNIRNCHKESPCIAILNKRKCHFFFFYKIGEQEGETGPVEGICNQWDVGG